MQETSLDPEKLCFLPATELLKLFKERKLSPVDVLKAQINKIERENDKIKAVTMKHYEEAMEQARESERRYEEGNPRPLEGITCAVKVISFLPIISSFLNFTVSVSG